MKISTIGSFAVITDTVSLQIAIQEAHGTARTLQAQHHIILLSAVLHADIHKNNSLLLEFFAGVPNGVNLAAMLEWLETFTAYDYAPARPSTALKAAKEAKIHKVEKRGKSFTRKADRELAALTPYYSLKAVAKEPKIFDGVKFSNSFANTLNAKKKEMTQETRDEVAAILLTLSQNIRDSFDVEAAPVAPVEAVKDAAKKTPAKKASKASIAALVAAKSKPIAPVLKSAQTH